MTNGTTGTTGTATHSPTGTATITGTVTATETNTPTACEPFTDVEQGDTFYEYINCLYCQGVISGYPAGTYIVANTLFPNCRTPARK